MASKTARMFCERRDFHLPFIAITIMLITITPSPSNGQAWPGCQGSCGNLTDIPYPFGTKERCYRDSEFLITCNTSFDPPKAFLQGSNIEVTNISLEGQLIISSPISFYCNNEDGSIGANLRYIYILGKYKLSDSMNKFTVVGCDVYATITGEQELSYKYISGCSSTCDSKDNVRNGTCSGVGCCQISLPKGVRQFFVNLSSPDNHSRVWEFNPCGYAFVVQENMYNFSLTDLNPASNIRQLPVVLDWAIGNDTCEVAQLNTSAYACKINSKCVNSTNGPGYLCKCKDGYKGNPYLKDGCKDIDECKDSELNDCGDRNCTNTEGHFTCNCPIGSREVGNNCTADQEPTHTDKLLPLKFVAVTLASVLIVLFAITWVFMMCKKRELIRLKEKFFRQNGGVMLQQQLSHLRERRSSEVAKLYTSEELENATNFFSETMIIGRGGFGVVYKGVLKDNTVVAIKKSNLVDENQKEQFVNEVIVLSQINHRNVVKLLGCCLETEVPLLVYEYVSNGTLYDQLHNRCMNSVMSWATCLRIAAETAGVLSYLHLSASVPIVHRDVKTTNILLDENFRAKVSDFGTSRLVPLDEVQLTTMVQGTLGYLDPEYFHTSQLTEKSDVYSFGVVLVELLTRRKVLCFEKPENERNSASYFLSSLKEGRLFQVLDARTTREASPEKLTTIAHLAKRCLSLKGEDRPTMKEVFIELEGLQTREEHPWVCDNSVESENLIDAPQEAFEVEGPVSVSIENDAMLNYIAMADNGGR